MSAFEGYVYVCEPDDAMASARPGARVTTRNRRPPYIAVSDSIQALTVARWPGKLWRVRVAEPAAVSEMPAAAGIARATAVDVLNEVPAARLFGPHGDKVCAVLDRARELDWAQARSFARARHLDAGKAYSRAWSNWLLSVGVASPFRVDFMSVVDTSPLRDTDFTGVLSTSAHPGSPVNEGLKVLHRTIRDRAAETEGGKALIIREDGEEGFEPVWLAACYALLEAAMAMGAPAVCEAEDRRIMCKAWNAVTSPDLLLPSN
jgi:hypothetical protein